MRKAFLSAVFFTALTASAQNKKIPGSSSDDEIQIKNPGFELKNDSISSLPKVWSFNRTEGFTAALDNSIKKSGNQSLRVNSVNDAPKKYLSFSQSVPVKTPNLKRITISAFIKTENVKGTAGLWCNAMNSSNKATGFASTQKNLKIDSTTNWKQYTLEFIIDTAVKKLTMGGAMQGTGTVWVDDFNISVNEIADAIPVVQESKPISAKEQKGDKEFIEWLTANTHEIKSVDAGTGFKDLQIFKSVLKDVRVAGLGEATHGTSEFFRMKHRMLEFLVKEMGFTSFYLEASMSRCRYINNYVLYGKGNLDTATAIQGYTVWRVEEVRDMIEWIRKYNETVAADKKVKFF